MHKAKCSISIDNNIINNLMIKSEYNSNNTYR